MLENLHLALWYFLIHRDGLSLPLQSILASVSLIRTVVNSILHVIMSPAYTCSVPSKCCYFARQFVQKLETRCNPEFRAVSHPSKRTDAMLSDNLHKSTQRRNKLLCLAPGSFVKLKRAVASCRIVVTKCYCTIFLFTPEQDKIAIPSATQLCSL